MDKLETLSDLVIKLLSYHQSGNSTLLRSIFDQSLEYSQAPNLDERFWRSNLRIALELSGHIELIETPSTQKWTITSPMSRIPKKKSVVFLSSKSQLAKEFLDRTREIKPLITTIDGFTIWQIETSEHEQSLKGKLYEHLPTRAKIEESVSDFVRGGPDFTIGAWEKFDFSYLKWSAIERDYSPQSGLYRSIEYRTGRSIWVCDSASNSWKFIFPEWAFMFAADRFRFELASIVRYSNGTISIPRAFRLPRILLKELVLSSDQVHIDWSYNFHGVDKTDYLALTNFLQKRGLAA